MHIFGEGIAHTNALEQAAAPRGIRASAAFVAALRGDGARDSELPWLVTEAAAPQEGPLMGTPTFDLDFPDQLYEV